MNKQDIAAFISDLDIVIEKIDNGAVNYADIKEVLADFKAKLDAISASLPEVATQGE